MEVHSSHVTRYSDASTFDEICINCGATDSYDGTLNLPCDTPPDDRKTIEQYYEERAKR